MRIATRLDPLTQSLIDALKQGAAALEEWAANIADYGEALNAMNDPSVKQFIAGKKDLIQALNNIQSNFETLIAEQGHSGAKTTLENKGRPGRITEYDISANLVDILRSNSNEEIKEYLGYAEKYYGKAPLQSSLTIIAQIQPEKLHTIVTAIAALSDENKSLILTYLTEERSFSDFWAEFFNHTVTIHPLLAQAISDQAGDNVLRHMSSTHRHALELQLLTQAAQHEEWMRFIAHLYGKGYFLNAMPPPNPENKRNVAAWHVFAKAVVSADIAVISQFHEYCKNKIGAGGFQFLYSLFDEQQQAELQDVFLRNALTQKDPFIYLASWREMGFPVPKPLISPPYTPKQRETAAVVLKELAFSPGFEMDVINEWKNIFTEHFKIFLAAILPKMAETELLGYLSEKLKALAEKEGKDFVQEIINSCSPQDKLPRRLILAAKDFLPESVYNSAYTSAVGDTIALSLKQGIHEFQKACSVMRRHHTSLREIMGKLPPESQDKIYHELRETAGTPEGFHILCEYIKEGGSIPPGISPYILTGLALYEAIKAGDDAFSDFCAQQGRKSPQILIPRILDHIPESHQKEIKAAIAQGIASSASGSGFLQTLQKYGGMPDQTYHIPYLDGPPLATGGTENALKFG